MNSASVLFLIGFISLVQFGTPAATASQESWLLISDLLKSDFEFPSGFQRQSDCSDMLSPESHLKRIVAQPDAEFRELSSKDKIRQVHLIADILSESISLVVMRSQDRMIPALAFNREILRGLSHRLQFLSALSRKDLSENLRELLMISHKFQALAVLAFYYDSVVRDSLMEFFVVTTHARPVVREDVIDHDLRALVLGSLAILQVYGIRAGLQPLQALGKAEETLLASVEESRHGRTIGGSLEVNIMILRVTLSQLYVFASYQLPEVEKLLISNVRSSRPMIDAMVMLAAAVGDTHLVTDFVKQIEDLLKLPFTHLLPNLRQELSDLRDQFRRPSDPLQVH